MILMGRRVGFCGSGLLVAGEEVTQEMSDMSKGVWREFQGVLNEPRDR